VICETEYDNKKGADLKEKKDKTQQVTKKGEINSYC